MLINIRYLIITVISIFLALGIGILVGAQLDSQSIILKQQKSLIEKVEAKFDELNQANVELENEIKRLKEENDKKETYIKNIFPDYIKDKLKGMNVIVIETSEDYVYTGIKQVLKMSGAQVSGLRITDKIMAIGEEEKSELLTHFGLSANQDIASFIVKIVAGDVASGKVENINYLREKGFIETQDTFAGPVNYVVMAGGSREKTNKHEIVDIALIREFKKRSIPVVGVETVDAANSYMDYYKGEKISTVDNVDTVIGQTSLVLVISGKKGNFGVKKTASALMPFVSEEGNR